MVALIEIHSDHCSKVILMLMHLMLNWCPDMKQSYVTIQWWFVV